jgi:hypothetical protein
MTRKSGDLPPRRSFHAGISSGTGAFSFEATIRSPLCGGELHSLKARLGKEKFHGHH